MPFQVLHSSDWHLGKRLYHKGREREFRLFLDWLLDQLTDVDLLLIAGDIFDTNAPPVWAQELYYRFLHRASQHCEIVVCAGNHDSALFLEAPRTLLKSMCIHVVGNPSALLQHKVQQYLQTEEQQEAASDAETDIYPPELLPIRSAEGRLQALVCALPYLKDSYLRSSTWGEQDREQKLRQGIAAYYRVLTDEAQRYLRQCEQGTLSSADPSFSPPPGPSANLSSTVPLIGMGHLFASGASTKEDDGVRELYIGSLGHFPASLFPAELDYVALGHIHQLQQLRAPGEGQLRYCGSPLPFSFSELSGEKVVLKLTFTGKECECSPITVPQWQPLVRLRGNATELEQGLRELAEPSRTQDSGETQGDRKIQGDQETRDNGDPNDDAVKPGVWLELEHSGELSENTYLREELVKLARQHNMEILHYRSLNLLALRQAGGLGALCARLAQGRSNDAGENHRGIPAQMLRELSPTEVFRQLLLQTSSTEQASGELTETTNAEQGSEVLWQLYHSLLEDIALEREAAEVSDAAHTKNHMETDETHDVAPSRKPETQ